ncbi:MAG: toprim domain-containing protein, partial [Verrucomicrobia bacterium]|nr:toprim domain-containing protein [Verrucomicrobiota bacterium]
GTTGKEAVFKTYGLGPDGSEQVIEKACPHGEILERKVTHYNEVIEKKASNLWQHSSSIGLSPYLVRKGVGNYGIRFHFSMKYGNAAIVPMLDEKGKLWSCQILNEDGSKRIITGSCIKGLFHKLKEPIDGMLIGIAESYVTAATCLELSGIPMICCFSANNMLSVAGSIRGLYPNSPIILFADNDRHLEERGLPNKGLVSAQKAIADVKENVFIVAPDFSDEKPSKETSDWNDLMRIKGDAYTKAILRDKIGEIYG